ncbi:MULTISPECIES: polysaccharide deacetylase family protein [Rummeliibacillus]|uniref:polysaccharide deacetylase family protein n=1 Tax=Rummeliibacillus TaxID=648802 RepID=UPI0011B78CC8|nr:MULTISPECIES: polysaccharide deacetylase family protein [Rummeliibacillus]
MIKQHATGIIIAMSIIITGIIANPFNASAQEFSWGFKKAQNEVPPEAGANFDQLLEKYGAVYKGKSDDKVMYLTFDCGYENGYTESILDTLKKENIQATFFLTGHYLTSATPLVKRMINEGHEIGNHSDKHPNMARLTKQQMLDEWQRFDKKLAELTDVERTVYARPPEGVFSEELLKAGQEAGYRHIFWSVAFKDWIKDKPQGWQYAYDNLMSQIHPGAIILMHTVSPDNAAALPKFIKDAEKKGYRFDSINNLVNDTSFFANGEKAS